MSIVLINIVLINDIRIHKIIDINSDIKEELEIIMRTIARREKIK